MKTVALESDLLTRGPSCVAAIACRSPCSLNWTVSIERSKPCYWFTGS